MFSSHSFWTSSSLDVPAGFTQEGYTGFLIHLLSAVRALIFLARRIQPFRGGGKYIGFGLRIETGAERTTIVDIFNIIQTVRDIGIQ